MSSPPKRKRRKPNRVPAIEKNPRLGYNIAVREFIGPHRLVVRTLGSQPRNTGSTPVGAAFASNPAPAGFCVKIGYNELKSGANPNPTIETLIKIANALGIGVDDLIK